MSIQSYQKWMVLRGIFLQWVLQVTAQFYLTVIHQNDLHAHYEIVHTYVFFAELDGDSKTSVELETCKWDNHCYGGFARAVHQVKTIKSDGFSDNVLNVNTGDFLQGTIYSVAGLTLAGKMAIIMEYNAMVLGHSDFSNSIKDVHDLLVMVGSKFVCTNIDFSGLLNTKMAEELRKLCPAYRIISYGARKVCVLGYTTPQTPKIIPVDAGIKFEDEVSALQRTIREVQAPDINIFVALGHSGAERDFEIAEQVQELDIVVGGHSHDLFWPNRKSPFVAGKPPLTKEHAKFVYPRVVGDMDVDKRKALVVQMGKYGRYLGVLNVTFSDDGRVIDWYSRPKLITKAMPEDPQAVKAFGEYQRFVEWLRRHREVGVSMVNFNRSLCLSAECNLGNLLADSFVWAQQMLPSRGTNRVVVGLVNSGMMQRGLERGTVLFGHLMEMLPYQNTLQVVELYGSMLKRMLEHGASRLKEGRDNPAFLQVSGLHVRYNLALPGDEIVESVMIACGDCPFPEYRPLEENNTYFVVTTDYLALGGDGYTMIREEALKIIPRGNLELTSLINYWINKKNVYTANEGRVVIMNSTASAATKLCPRKRLMHAQHILHLVISLVFTCLCC